MTDNEQLPGIGDWYTPAQAVDRLRKISGRPIAVSYLAKLYMMGKVRRYEVSASAYLYYKPDIDSYFVEERGVKSARNKRLRGMTKAPKKPVGRPRKGAKSVA